MLRAMEFHHNPIDREARLIARPSKHLSAIVV
jgi:hypothetical protein